MVFLTKKAKYITQTKTKKYVELLLEKAQKANINLSKYPSIISFAKIVSKQNAFDSKKLSGEIQSILNELKETLTFNEYKNLAEKASKKELEVEFYFELLQKAKQYDILSKNKYKNTNAFLEYLLLNQKFNTIELANEEDLLIKELNNKLAETEQEKEIFFLKNFLDSLSHYLTNKMTAKEYDKFINNIDTFKTLWAKYIDIDNITNITEYFNLVEDFYKNNIERNRVFIKNLFGKTPADKGNIFRIKNSKINHEQKVIEELSQGKKVHIVITGGFHTDGFDKLLQDENINYIVITPNITENAAYSEELFQNFFDEQYNITNNTFANRPLCDIISLFQKGEIKDVRPDGDDVIIEYISGEIVRLKQLSQENLNKDILTDKQIDKTVDAFLKLQKLHRTIREQKRAEADLSIDKNIIIQLADLEDAVDGLGDDENIQKLKESFIGYIDEITAANPEIPSDTGKLILPLTKKTANIILNLILFIPALIYKFFTKKDLHVKKGILDRFYSITAGILENIFLAPVILLKPETFVLWHYNNKKNQWLKDEYGNFILDKNGNQIQVSERERIQMSLNWIADDEATKADILRLDATARHLYERTSMHSEGISETFEQIGYTKDYTENLKKLEEIDERIRINEEYLEKVGFTERYDNTEAMFSDSLLTVKVLAFLFVIFSFTGFEFFNGTFFDYLKETFFFYMDNILYIIGGFAGIFGIEYFGKHITYNLSIDRKISKAKGNLRENIISLINIFPNDIDDMNRRDLIKKDRDGNFVYHLGPIFYDILTAFPEKSFSKYFEDSVSGILELLTVLEILKGHNFRGDETNDKVLKSNINKIVDYFEKMPYKNTYNRRTKITVSKIIDDINMVLETHRLTFEERKILKSLRQNLYEFKRPHFKLSIFEARRQEQEPEKEQLSIFRTATEWVKSVYTNTVDSLQRATYSLLFKDNTEYTIVANADDYTRQSLAESLAASGIKVNLVLVGESGLIKETPSRIAYAGRYLAYGLIDDSVKNLKVFGYDNIDGETKFPQLTYLSALLNYINDTSKSTVKILDLPENLNDIDITDMEDLSKNWFTSVGVGKSVYKLFFEAIEKKLLPAKKFDNGEKIKTKRTADMQIKPSLVASNISADKIDTLGRENINRLVEQGVTTIIISVDDKVLQNKTDKIKEILQTAHASGLKVMFSYKFNLKNMLFEDIIEWTRTFDNKVQQFKENGGIDGLQIDLSESGDIANTFGILMNFSELAKIVNKQNVDSFLALKMPANISPVDYAQIFGINGIKTVLDYDSKYIESGIASFQSENVIINISADKNGSVSIAKLSNIFERNKVSMISFDLPILEAIDSSDGFLFNGLSLAKFITSIFETTPEGQNLKGINNGRTFVNDRNLSLSEAALKKLCDMYISDDFNIAEINDILATNFKENISKYELKGFIAGIIQIEELNRFDAAGISFDKEEYGNLLLQSLLDYRLIKGISFADTDTSKNVQDMLIAENFGTNIKPEITKVINILNGADGNIDTIITMLSSIKDNSAISNEEKAAVLEGLLLLLFNDARKPEADFSSMLSENMDIKKMHAILSAA